MAGSLVRQTASVSPWPELSTWQNGYGLQALFDDHGNVADRFEIERSRLFIDESLPLQMNVDAMRLLGRARYSSVTRFDSWQKIMMLLTGYSNHAYPQLMT